jgi:YfiH family protein
MSFLQSNLGLEIKTENYHIFFGNKNASLDALTVKFPQYQYFRVKQIHSALAVEADSELREADAHYTDKNGRALIIATADCLPILIYDKKTSLTASVHAGWKGVATKILPITIAALLKRGADIATCSFFIGPHILQNSFEIEVDIKDQLKESIIAASEFEKLFFLKQIEGKTKFYLSLRDLVQAQVIEMGGTTKQIISSDIDTKTNLDWHSFRRDKAASGRNISFIAKLN